MSLEASKNLSLVEGVSADHQVFLGAVIIMITLYIPRSSHTYIHTCTDRQTQTDTQT